MFIGYPFLEKIRLGFELSLRKLANLLGYGTGVKGFLTLLLPVPSPRHGVGVDSNTAQLDFSKPSLSFCEMSARPCLPAGRFGGEKLISLEERNGFERSEDRTSLGALIEKKKG
ncbi:hypothetical protein COY35_01315 [candidate division WWE3 bacterium CG_4_10_14_0_2_um_filter_47_8]|nr:MAG: hypothetical protein COY35_01315 [candidate division WWE3 bacterium CG_4_10_14_0_2_um_filter_47_8]